VGSAPSGTKRSSPFSHFYPKGKNPKGKNPKGKNPKEKNPKGKNPKGQGPLRGSVFFKNFFQLFCVEHLNYVFHINIF
jgi:hypothetical protein